MKILECTGRFLVRGGPAYQPGETVALPDDTAEAYLRDFPDHWRVDCFRDPALREAACVAALERPAMDKMLKRPDAKKGRHE